MQVERVQIASRQLLSKGCVASWFVPLTIDASVDDVLRIFAQFLIDGKRVQIPMLQTCFDTIMREEGDCMFVFMRRGTDIAAGILRSNKPLFSRREQGLMQILGQETPWNLPVWTWREQHHDLAAAMEHQCRDRKGPCMGIWCYR
tara:strand:- start:779 stop:1213 length:435 start_codon:yes stop_codon:yes gene_type:complete